MDLKEYNQWSANFRQVINEFNTLVEDDLSRADRLLNTRPRGSIARHLDANDIQLDKIAHKLWDMAMVYQQLTETIGMDNVMFDAEDA